MAFWSCTTAGVTGMWHAGLPDTGNRLPGSACTEEAVGGQCSPVQHACTVVVGGAVMGMFGSSPERHQFLSAS